ncbi:enoyl-ACP reductase FabI [Streptomyces spectabilis]|uniref:Enoyl-[acyl-carrier-protein] reductase [NADH] n=1 Tax=Streptomyces spectabilis TaxID=68270 RepID=A0A5P2X099_STRST|nr:enoyl-ACP reductase FabI [Streptomyces spectabilis]MBB5100978.1 enoyl-[acyl-carrier protein] reductase I [Streptomyces spectabilis]MCI3900191.1 enoyl-ACP reductase FabI [Streptomyces spectabilis]QEV57798.1 enoyl-[acyl-carrier-protein] reductase FabI [Streptomyces spectabilis]GGV08808.1 enoyl-[acyl-carrier-protein] reductase [NADH] [Streptomyces spectabilis]
MLLAGKRILVTGVLTESSIAFGAARTAQEQGAEVVLTGFGRGLPVTRLVAKRLPAPCDVLPMDVTRPQELEAVAAKLERRWGALDGVVHAAAYAPPSTLSGGFLTAGWEDVAQAFHVSTYSFAAFGRVFGPLLARSDSGALVGLDFDAERAWPGYDWMGVAKAGLESCCRYLARELGRDGTRVNLVAAGPLNTVAARSLDGFALSERLWPRLAPLGWDVTDAAPVGRVVCALLSDWLPAMTGEVLHCDGGAHAIGAPAAEAAPALPAAAAAADGAMPVRDLSGAGVA